MNLAEIVGHDFVNRDGELFCSDSQNPRHHPRIGAAQVDLVFHTGELMGRCAGALFEINLCEGCYEMVILHLVKEIERLKNKKCPHDLAKEFLEGDD